jgi:hypothetical protein
MKAMPAREAKQATFKLVQALGDSHVAMED